MEEEDGGPIEEEIVNLGRGMGLEVDTKDVNDLIAKHADELTTDELVALQQEKEEQRSTEVTDEEGEGEEVLTTAQINEMLRQ